MFYVGQTIARGKPGEYGYKDKGKIVEVTINYYIVEIVEGSEAGQRKYWGKGLRYYLVSR